MNFAKELQSFLRWMAGIARNFLRRSPRQTILVVTVSALRGILQLLAFIIPLKVILLAATPVIPAYLPFVELTHKNLWIVSLALGAIVIYLIVQSIAPLLEAWSLRTGKTLLRKANDLPVNANEAEQAQKAFADFTRVFASVLFFSIGCVVLIWLSPWLLFSLAFMIFALFSVASFVLKGDNNHSSSGKRRFIENPSKYVNVWEGCTFFASFAIILMPFVIKGEGNVTFALISFILIRRMIAELGSAIKTSLRLSTQRSIINALFYRSYQVTNTRQLSAHSLQQLFNKTTRDNIFSKMLGGVLCADVSTNTRWRDSEQRNVKWFQVELQEKGSGKVHQFDAWVYDAASRFQADHLMFLFDHMDSVSLPRPALIHRTSHEGYEIVVQSTNYAPTLTTHKWKELHTKLVSDLILTPLPRSLVQSYRRTHAILPDLLTLETFERLEVALDSEEEERIFRQWMKIRPIVIERLRSQPLVLINPDLKLTHTVFDENTQRWLHTFWGRWRIDVLGAALVQYGLFANGGKVCSELQLRSNKPLSYVWVGDLEIGGLCQQLIASISSQRYKSAFHLMHTIYDQLGVDAVLGQENNQQLHKL